MKSGMLAFFIGMSLLIGLNGCKKNVANESTPVDFIGKWTLAAVLGNDYWGGPLYWKPAAVTTTIEFTADGKYYRKNPAETVPSLIGSYQVLPDSTIQITQVNPVNPSFPAYTLRYAFSSGGYLTWGDFGTEGVVKEKFHLYK